MKDWKLMELHPVDPAFTAQMEDAQIEATEFVSKIMDIQSDMIEKALRTCLVYVPSDEIELHNVGENIRIVARSVPMFEVSSDMLGVDVTVTGEWLSWPPPGPYDKTLSTAAVKLVRR